MHLSQSQDVLFGFSIAVCATIAAGVYLLHYILLFSFSQKHKASLSVQTSLEGILLQGYFTGALSYLPLASDFYLEGETKARAQTQLSSLLSLLAITLSLDLIATLFSLPILELCSAHILLYCFVISFPLKPLDGSGIFAYSKKLWGLVFGFTMLCFLLNMPESFYGIL